MVRGVRLGVLQQILLKPLLSSPGLHCHGRARDCSRALAAGHRFLPSEYLQCPESQNSWEAAEAGRLED